MLGPCGIGGISFICNSSRIARSTAVSRSAKAPEGIVPACMSPKLEISPELASPRAPSQNPDDCTHTHGSPYK